MFTSKPNLKKTPFYYHLNNFFVVEHFFFRRMTLHICGWCSATRCKSSTSSSRGMLTSSSIRPPQKTSRDNRSRLVDLQFKRSSIKFLIPLSFIEFKFHTMGFHYSTFSLFNVTNSRSDFKMFSLRLF